MDNYDYVLQHNKKAGNGSGYRVEMNSFCDMVCFEISSIYEFSFYKIKILKFSLKKNFLKLNLALNSPNIIKSSLNL